MIETRMLQTALKLRYAGIALIVMLMVPSSARSAASGDVTGVWMTDDGQAAVQVYACGDMRCGRIVWLKTPLDAQGRPMRDGYNPSPEDRQRPLCGVQILYDLKRQGDGSWDGGRIYDPEEGKTYDVTMKASGSRLEVRGYIVSKLIGETVVWTRWAGDLKSCR